MWYNTSNNKKIVFVIIFFLLIFIVNENEVVANAYAEEDLSVELEINTNKILDDIDTDELDVYLENNSKFGLFSFKEFAKQQKEKNNN